MHFSDSAMVSRAESKKVCGQEKITATSGKDVLGITKGDKENSYIVHFSDSAMVSRAVARGYVTVNGKEVELTEDTKRQLLKVDKEASAAREKAYQDYVMQYEMAVAKQQSEAWRKADKKVLENYGCNCYIRYIRVTIFSGKI